MKLLDYLNCRVHIVLHNYFYYKGKVISADENSLTIIDLRGRRVSLSKNSILTIEEISNGV